ncbi:MAG: hypothetical protein EHM72_13000 [Calditrichaeota bacterium]|nr:MAG: hypothetical protein EHM72_13000 [Calditrichota bacterium]
MDNEYALLLQRHGGEKNLLRNYRLHSRDLPKLKQDIETNIKVKQFLLDLTKNLPLPGEEDVSAYYQQNEDRFVLPEQIHAAHIVMRPNPAKPQVAYEEMKALRQRLLAGENFAALATEHSSCQDDGGDLGWFAAGKMAAGFDAVVFSMNVGEISPVFLTEFGFHIATVYDQKAKELQPLAAVRQEIVETLKTERGDDFIAAWVDEHKSKAVIQVEE